MFNPQSLGTGRDVAVFVGLKAGSAMQAAVPSEVAGKISVDLGKVDGKLSPLAAVYWRNASAQMYCTQMYCTQIKTR